MEGGVEEVGNFCHSGGKINVAGFFGTPCNFHAPLPVEAVGCFLKEDAGSTNQALKLENEQKQKNEGGKCFQ